MKGWHCRLVLIAMTGLICVDISTAAAQVGTTNLTVTGATLVSIGVTPATTSLPTGIGQQFTATGTYSDGSVADLTGAVTWSSSAPSIATITSGGLATGVSAGARPCKSSRSSRVSSVPPTSR